MSTLLVEPVHEVEREHWVSTDVPESTARQPEVIARVEQEKELNPMLVVFIACVVGFNLAAAVIGTLTAWIYQLRHSGAFTP